METHNYNQIQQQKLEIKHLINFFGQLTLRDRVKFLAVLLDSTKVFIHEGLGITVVSSGTASTETTYIYN